MVNPYETLCGHIFSKEGLDYFIQKKKTFNCPQAGCKRKNMTKNSIKPVEQHDDNAKSQFMETFFGSSQQYED